MSVVFCPLWRKVFLSLTWVTLLIVGVAQGVAESEGFLDVGELKRDLAQIERRIDETKAKIRDVKDARFLPDLHFLLADFYSKQSRYLYQIKVLEAKGEDAQDEVDFSAELKPKHLAIETYNGIIEKFPNLERVDEAMFLKAHELRELGQLPEMSQVLSQIGQNFPKSPFWEESQLILGNYLLDHEKRVNQALEIYDRIVKRSPNVFTAFAHERRGWCYIHRKEFENSLRAFEEVFRTYQEGDRKSVVDEIRNRDVRRDALVSMVWPYSEVSEKRLAQMGGGRIEVIEYFRSLAPDLGSYRASLMKLGQRLDLKRRFVESTKVYFELLRVATDVELRVDAIERLYLAVRNTNKRWPLHGFVEEVTKTLGRMEFDERFREKRKKAFHDLEIFARDVATRSHERARKTNLKEDYDWAKRDYLAYLNQFEDAKYSHKMRLNLAEVYYHMNEWTLAGRNYELSALDIEAIRKKQPILRSSIYSYVMALKDPDERSRLEIRQARSGLRDVGKLYISIYPKDPAVSDIEFNIAQSFYDERKFDVAIATLKSYIAKYPRSRKTALGVNLLLDVYHQLEDFDSLLKEAKSVLANRNIRDRSIRISVSQMIQQIELKKIQLSSTDDDEEYSAHLLRFAKQYKGSPLSEQAAYEAFLKLKQSGDPKAYEVGEQMVLQHRTSDRTKQVLLDLGRTALTTADFRRAAGYFELFGERYKGDPLKSELLGSAAEIREHLGQYKMASHDYLQLGKWKDVARMDYMARDWSSLARTSKKVGGVTGDLWLAMAEYHLRGFRAAERSLRRSAEGTATTPSEQSDRAYAQFLLAVGQMERYDRIRMKRGLESRAVMEKGRLLEEITKSLNGSAQAGEGQWVVASLDGLGRVHKEFADFLKESDVPKNLRGQMRNVYKQELRKQIAKYETLAKGYFRRCIDLATRHGIVSDYVQSCRTSGLARSKPFEDQLPKYRSLAKAQNSRIESVRAKLFNDPKNEKLFLELAQHYYDSKDYLMSQMVLDHLIKMNPNNGKALSLRGTTALAIHDPQQGYIWFKKALKVDRGNRDAQSGLARIARDFQSRSPASLR